MAKMLKFSVSTSIPVFLLITGALVIGGLVEKTDRQMREDLLSQTRLLAETLDSESIQALTGTEADLDSPVYLRLKEQFAAVRNANPEYRFVYLMGQKADGTVFFFVDDRLPGDPDEAPAGMIYEDVPEGFRSVFATGTGTATGPFTDQWGSFVSGCVPLTDHESGKVAAALAIDFDAGRWKQMVAAHSVLPAGLFFLGLTALFLFGSAMLSRRARREGPLPWRQRNLEAILTALCGLLLTLFAAWIIQHESQENRFARFRQTAESRTAALAEVFSDLQDVELEGLARFFEGSEDVTAAEFQHYAQYLTKNRAIQAWGWIAEVPASDKTRFEKNAAATGAHSFQIWQRDADGKRVPAHGREVYYPVLLVPLYKNPIMFARDLCCRHRWENDPLL
jgi:hypothetical protein